MGKQLVGRGFVSCCFKGSVLGIAFDLLPVSAVENGGVAAVLAVLCRFRRPPTRRVAIVAAWLVAAGRVTLVLPNILH